MNDSEEEGVYLDIPTFWVDLKRLLIADFLDDFSRGPDLVFPYPRCGSPTDWEPEWSSLAAFEEE